MYTCCPDDHAFCFERGWAESSCAWLERVFKQAYASGIRPYHDRVLKLSRCTGAYRFWRDLGYAIGALVTGAIADWIGIPWSVGVAAILTALAALIMALVYVEINPEDDIYSK